MIDGLIDRIRKTQVTDKDPAAEQRIQAGLASSPDALYVLAQTVLVQGYGLGKAQAQINDLQARTAALQEQLQGAAEHARTSGSGGGFLSHLFGSGNAADQPAPLQNPPYQPVNNPGYAPNYPPNNAPGPSNPPYSSQPYPGGGYPAPPPAYPPQGYPAPSSGIFGSGGGGFLQGAMRTAAGVAAGEMMFQGMESLFHGLEHGGGGGSGFMGTGERGSESVVNNYYDDGRSGDENRGGGDRGLESQGRDGGGFYNPSDDASRSGSGDSETRFADNGSDSSNDSGQDSGDAFSGGGGASFDDSSSFDDNSGGDDSGSY